jgi:AcrR family transcriptional regulator
VVEPSPRPERVDAARNRARVLDAAGRLFAERGATAVSMEDVARAAGVGKGTLYRRYPDKAALAAALLDEHERQLQEQLLRGAPPLGPGAPPAERLAAFYAAMVDLLEPHLDLTLAAETGPARYRTGAYDFWRTHVRVLVRDAGLADPDDVLPDILLSPLASELQSHLTARNKPREAVKAALAALAHKMLPEP